MRLLIATPAYGGLISTDYVTSLVRSIAGFRQDKIDFSVLTIANESLINRARNKCAHLAMVNGFDKMLFIDADIGWEYNDIRRLILSDKKLVGGTYPLKDYPITLNFNVLPEQSKMFSHRKTKEEFEVWRKECANEHGEVEVMHIPTGFMMIDCSVFETLKPHVNSYSHRDMKTGQEDTIYEYFPVRVHNNILESEDWAFCSIAKEQGIKVYFNTNVITTHAGTHIFRHG